MKLSECLKTVYYMAVLPDPERIHTPFDKEALKEFAELYTTVVELERESILEQESEDE